MSNMSALLAAVKKAKDGGSKGDRDDQYFYYPVRDAAGNGAATLRFLPGKDDDEIPFVKLYTHGFKGPTGKWLIDNCPTTIEDECPVCAANGELYARLSKDDARKHGMNRKTSYISRVFVVEDKKTPENEGKVFLFKFGSKIFDKIVDELQPEFDDKEAVDVFSLTNGANFKLRIRIYEGNTNYDKSEFEKPSVCKADVTYDETNDIQAFIAADKFKSKEALQKRLDLVLGNTLRVPAEKESKDSDEDDMPAPKPEKRSTRVESSSDDGDDDILAMMKKLAEDD